MEENILSEKELLKNIQTQQSGEGEFVTKGSPLQTFAIGGPEKGTILKTQKKFEKDFIPGSSSVVSREVLTDITKVTNLPNIQDVLQTDNKEFQKEIESYYGFKNAAGETFKLTDGTDAKTRLNQMNLGRATEFVYKSEDGSLKSIKIPYDAAIAKMFKPPANYVPPSVTAILGKSVIGYLGEGLAKEDATKFEIFKTTKDQGTFPSWMPFIGGDKMGVTLDNALGTNFDEVGGQIALAKAYNAILIKAGLNQRQRYGILKERMANKFKDLYNIMGYGRRGVRYFIEAPIFLVGEAYDLLDEKLKENTGFSVGDSTGTNDFKDSVSRTNFYDMILPLQSHIIQDGFAAQGIDIDLGTAELLASMFTATPGRIIATAAEIGIPSNIAKAITTKLGKRELAKYEAFRNKRIMDIGPFAAAKDPDFDKKLLNDFTELRAKQINLGFFSRKNLGDVPLIGKIYSKINSLRTGPAIVHGLQIKEAAKTLSENVAVKKQLSVVQNLEKQRDNFIDSHKGTFDLKYNKRLKLLNKQIEVATKDLRYEISTANVPQFIKDIAKGNKDMIIGSAVFGQLAQESGVDVPMMEMIGLFSGLSWTMAGNKRAFLSKIKSIGGLYPGITKKTTFNLTEELAKKVNTFTPEFGETLAARIKYIDSLQQELKNAGVPEELLNTSFATMSNLAILQTLEETSRLDINVKSIAKFGSVISDFQEIYKSKQALIEELRGVTLRLAQFARRGEDGEEPISQMSKFVKTVEVALKYAENRANMLKNDIDTLQQADMASIKSLITGTVGKLSDSPIDNDDVSSALNRVYKLGFKDTVFPDLNNIKAHNENINSQMNSAIKDKTNSLKTELLLLKAQKRVKPDGEIPDLKNSDHMFLLYGENKRNYENAEVSKFYTRLDKAKFVDADGKLVGQNATTETMDLLEEFIDAIPVDERKVFMDIGGGTIGTSKQSTVFTAFDQTASDTIDKIFESLPADQLFSESNPKGFKNADDMVNSILAASPYKDLKFMPKNLRAVYVMYKQGKENGLQVDSLKLNFDQLKELKSSFSRLQAKYYNPADMKMSNKFLALKNSATKKFGEFEIIDPETNEVRNVGDLFVLDEKGNRVPVSRVLADGDAAHQTYMNRYFDNKVNYNYFFKGRNKAPKTNIDPLGISLEQQPSFTENVDKIYKMNDNELLKFKGDFLKRFGKFRDETPIGGPPNIERQGTYFIEKDSEDGKTLTAILELKVAEFITDAAKNKGYMNSKEYAEKLLKLEKAYTGIDKFGNEVSLINVRKIEKDLFYYSPASVGNDLYNEGQKRLEDSLKSISKKNFVSLNDTYKDYKTVERNIRSVLPADLKEGTTLIEVATTNSSKLKQVKEGILIGFGAKRVGGKLVGGKYGAKELDRLVTEVFMEDLVQKTFKSTGRSVVLGSGDSLVTEVDMNVDKLKEIIGFNDPAKAALVNEIIGEKRASTLTSMVKWMSEQYDMEKVRANLTGIPRNFSVESYISRFYSINRGVISARYVGTEAVLQQFRLRGHKLFKTIIEDPEVGQLFMEIVKTGQPLSREKEIQFFNALVSNLVKIKTFADAENPEQTVIINNNYKAKYQEYDISGTNFAPRQ